jgi:hypothetical protein
MTEIGVAGSPIKAVECETDGACCMRASVSPEH